MRYRAIVGALLLSGCAGQESQPMYSPPVATAITATVDHQLGTVTRASSGKPSSVPAKSAHRDEQARQPNPLAVTAIDLIRDSRMRYSGSCACPYDTDRAGRRCGGRSAYSRPGGASPLCFEHDVTPEMIARVQIPR